MKSDNVIESQNHMPKGILIIDKGNGEWYHGYDFENPLEHRWHITENIAICHVCQMKIKKQK